MAIQLNKILFLLFYIICSCNANEKKEIIEQTNLTNKEPKIKIPDFLYEKYFTGFRLNVDGSTIAEHPFYSFLDCENEGYFEVHFIPKNDDLKTYWRKIFFEENVYDYDDLEQENKLIQSKIKNIDEYSIFSIYVASEYIENKRDCSEEGITFKPKSPAIIYKYNQQNNWSKLNNIPAEDIFQTYTNSFFNSDSKDLLFKLYNDFNSDGVMDSIKVTQGNEIQILLSDSNTRLKIFQNNEILNSSSKCPNPPLDSIIAKENYFTIEKLNCSNEYFYEEFITYKWETDKFLLYKYGAEITSRKEPDRIFPIKIWTTKDFGQIEFEDTSEEFLSQLRQNEPKK